MNHTLIKLLIQVISDNIDFNNQIKELIVDRNKTISEGLDMIQKELEKERKK